MISYATRRRRRCSGYVREGEKKKVQWICQRRREEEGAVDMSEKDKILQGVRESRRRGGERRGGEEGGGERREEDGN